MSRIDSGERTRLACWQRRPFPSFVDDATLVEFVADKARQALDDFMTWETAAPSGWQRVASDQKQCRIFQ